MQKLVYCCMLVALFTFQSTIHAFDEGSLAVPLFVANGALVVTGCLYKQHSKIVELEKQLQKAPAAVNSKDELVTLQEQLDKLTQQSNITTQELQEKLATKVRTLGSLLNQYNIRGTSLKEWETFEHDFPASVPFLCVKKENLSKELLEKLTALNFLKSERAHKVPGLVTYISSSDAFSPQEKNMLSDEENYLEKQDRVFDEISSILAETKSKVGKLQ